MPDPSSASEEDGSADSKLLPPVLNALEGASSKPTADHAHADSNILRRRYKPLVACLLLFTCLFSWSTYTAFIWRDPWEATRCRMAYMSPGYIRLDSLNESHSRLAGKYSLWLYREQGWDLSNKPHGVPVLFAPGNAGSSQQVRSLAAAAARQYYSSPGRPHEGLAAAHHQELDFFAAHFNEDFSAFHAGTLKEQAQYLADSVNYILSLYADQGDKAPTSVIVIAHSMGGIAARYMFLQDDFREASVKTLVTLSTPHTLPPATFDRGVERIYQKINAYWRESYKQSHGPLHDTLFISIAGGIADTMVSSDYTDLSEILPPSNGFSVITTSIPTLYSPVDHQAMMWCDQLRHQIISALLQGTDSRRPDRSRPLQERLSAFQLHLLTGLELQPSPTRILERGNFGLDGLESAQRYLGQLQLDQDSVVSDGLYLVLPRDAKTQEAQARRLRVMVNGNGVRLDYYACIEEKPVSDCRQLASPVYAHIPTEVGGPRLEQPTPEPKTIYAELDMPADRPFCLVKVSKERDTSVYVSIAPAVEEVPMSLLRAYFFGWTFNLQTTPKSYSGRSFQFTNFDSSLLVYALDIKPESDCTAHEPVVRISSGGTFESHFFSGPVQEAPVHLHSGAPYLSAPSAFKSMHLQIWHEPICNAKIRLSVKRKASLGTLVTRYRSIIASWPTFFLLGIMRNILVPASRTNGQVSQQASFEASLRRFLLSDMKVWLGVTAAMGVAQVALDRFNLFPHQLPDILVGTRHMAFLWLAPALLALTASLIIVSHWLMNGMVYILGAVYALSSWTYRLESQPREERSRARITTFILLSLFVILFAPHQFAMLSLFLIQLVTTVRARAMATNPSKDTNYTVSLLLLWLLPQNGAILVVWLRNLQAGWWWPFPSDHNVLAILGPMLLVEYLRSGKDLKIPSHQWVVQATQYLLTFAMLVVLLWGGRYVYVVGEVVNIVLVWVAVLQYDGVRRFLQ